MKNTANYNLKKPEGTDIVNIDDLNYNADIVDGELKKVNDGLNTKVDKASGKSLSTNDFDNNYKKKLDGIQAGATNYTHPSSHPAAMISEDANHRFVTDSEKNTWNNKASAHDHPYRSNSWVPNWGEVTGKPSTFNPSSHTHSENEIVDLKENKFNTIESNYASVLSLLNSVDAPSCVDYIEGNTLVNLVQDIDWSTAGNSAGFDKTPISNGMRYVKNSVNVTVYPKIIIDSTASLLKENTTYTIVLTVNTNTTLRGMCISKGGDAFAGSSEFYKSKNEIINNGIYKINFATPSRSEMTDKLKLGFNNFGISDQGKYIELSNLMIIEGDLTNYDFNTYFEGMQSLNRIGVLSSYNLGADTKIVATPSSSVTNLMPCLPIDLSKEIAVGLVKNNSFVKFDSVAVTFFNKNQNKIGWVTLNGLPRFYNFNLNATAYYFMIQTVGNENVNCDGLFVCYKENFKGYRPAKFDKIDILNNIDLKGLPNGIRDKIYKDGSVEKNIEEIVIDENTPIYTYGLSGTVYYAWYDLSVIKGYKKGTDLFSMYSTDISNTATKIGINISSNNNVYFVTPTEMGLDTKEKFLQWIKTHHTKVQYELATPVREKLDKNLNISSFENGTLFVDSNIPCNIKYSYATNLSSAVSSLTSYSKGLENKIEDLKNGVESSNNVSITLNSNEVKSLNGAVEGQGVINNIEGNTLVNLINGSDGKGDFNTSNGDDQRIWNFRLSRKLVANKNITVTFVIKSYGEVSIGFRHGSNIAEGSYYYIGKKTGLINIKVNPNDDYSDLIIYTPTANENAVISNIMVFEGDLTNYNFNTYFEGMQSINKINILSNGTNLFDLKSDKFTKITDYKIENDALILNSSKWDGALYTVNVKQNTNYTFSFLGNWGTRVGIGTDRSYDQYVYTNYNNDKNETLYPKKVSINTGSNNILYIKFTIREQGFPCIHKNIQLEEGTEFTPYQEYKEDKIDILNNMDLRGLPNRIRDKIYEDGIIERNVGEFIFNCSNGFKYMGGSNIVDVFTIDNWSKTNNVLPTAFNRNKFMISCNKKVVHDYRHNPAEWDSAETVAIFNTGESTHPNLTLVIRKSENVTDLNMLNTWLQNNPIRFQTQLATPIIENINKPLLLSSFTDGSISMESNIPTSLEYTYSTNLNSSVKSINDGVIKIKEELNNKAPTHEHPYKADNWLPNWNDVQGKPSTFNPSSHTHDDRYYTEGEINNLLNAKATKDEVKAAQNKADQAFQFANNGKNAIANAVTAKGVSANPNDTFSVLADKIRQIKVGKKVAKGIVPCARNILVNDLGFKPSIVYLNSTGREVNRPGESWNRIMSSLDNCIGVTYYLDFTSVASGGGVRCMGDPIYLNGGQRIQILDNGFSINLGDNSFSFNGDINWIAIE